MNNFDLCHHLDVMADAGYDVAVLRLPWRTQAGAAHSTQCAAVVTRGQTSSSHERFAFCSECSSTPEGAYWNGLEQRIRAGLNLAARVKELIDIVEGVLNEPVGGKPVDLRQVDAALAAHREMLQHLHPEGVGTPLATMIEQLAEGAAQHESLFPNLGGAAVAPDVYMAGLLVASFKSWSELDETRPMHRIVAQHAHLFPAGTSAGRPARPAGSGSGGKVLHLVNPGSYVNFADTMYADLATREPADAVVSLSWERDLLADWVDERGCIHYVMDYDADLPELAYDDGELTIAVLDAPTDPEHRSRVVQMALDSQSGDPDVSFADLLHAVITAHA